MAQQQSHNYIAGAKNRAVAKMSPDLVDIKVLNQNNSHVQ